MDKKIAFMAFAFVIAPFLLAACDDSGTTVVPTDDSQVVEQEMTNTQETGENSVKPTEEVTPVAVDLDKLIADLVGNQPAFFKNADVKYTGIKELDAETIMAPYKEELLKAYLENNMYDADWDYLKSIFRWFEVGEIMTGKYEGQKLILSDMICDGMCMYPTVYRFAYDGETKELTALSAISIDADPASYVAPLLENDDTTTVLSGVTLPEEITLPDGRTKIYKSMDDGSFMSGALLTEVMFTDLNVGKVYGQKNGLGCLYVLKPDGSIAKYEYDPGFFEDEKMEIVWNDGSTNTNLMNSYSYTHYGCGIQGNCYTVETPDMNTLTEVGATSEGVKLYTAKNPVRGADKVEDGSMTEAQQTLDQYYDIYFNYASYDENLPDPVSFDEYVTKKPILYWVDPLGRLSSLVHNDYKPQAECGKPVVYLYPERTMDVSVKVLIDEFSKTVPEHGENGWTVSATPDSQIFNYADGQTYPYLFWEGHKKGGLNVDQGFMVSRSELSSFLPDALAKMGLNEVETRDFMDFWYPIMSAHSEDYFFISFAGTEDFNKVAPLEIEPNPDTLIRVFMYYNPVSKPFAVAEQTLRSVPRNGFTVVEWGGTSSRPWVNQE